MAEPETLSGLRQSPAGSNNPPAALGTTARDTASRARAALGATAAAAPAAPADEDSEGAGEELAPARAAVDRRAVRAERFQAPSEVEFEFNPPEPLRLANSNVPLTIGLLLSIVAAFVVFVASVAGPNAGEDPIMPAFWRALAALAVLITLSFAASWFMPAPLDRRELLDRLDAEDRAAGRRPETSRFDSLAAEEEEEDAVSVRQSAKGHSVDLTVDDFDSAAFDEDEDGADDDLDELGMDDEEDFPGQPRADFAATRTSTTAGLQNAVGRAAE